MTKGAVGVRDELPESFRFWVSISFTVMTFRIVLTQVIVIIYNVRIFYLSGKSPAPEMNMMYRRQCKFPQTICRNILHNQTNFRRHTDINQLFQLITFWHAHCF